MSGIVTSLAATALGLVAGGVAGLVFFGGLARSVRRLPDSSRPAALMVASLVGRFAVLTLILLGLALLGMVPLVAGVVGMLVVRSMLIRRAAPTRSPARR